MDKHNKHHKNKDQAAKKVQPLQPTGLLSQEPIIGSGTSAPNPKSKSKTSADKKN